MKYKPDIDQVRKRLSAFWEQELIDRACLCVLAPSFPGAHISMFHNPQDLTQQPEALQKYWFDPETIYHNNIQRLEQTYLGGDALPVVFQNYGTSGHCNYLGAVPTLGNDTLWFDPVWKSLKDVEQTFSQDSLQQHLKIADYLTQRAQDQYFVGMPDSTGTMDAIGHLYGSEKVLMAMVEEPETLAHAIAKVNQIWTDSNEAFYRISARHNQGGVHAWMHLLAPGRLTHMQCDMSVMFSADMYEEFVLDELNQQMQWLEYPVYHFDGIEQERHLDLLLSLPKLKAIQWTHVAGQPSAAHFIPLLQKIQRAGKSLVIMAPPEDVKPLVDQLSAAGLYIHTEVNSPEEGEQLLAYVTQNSRER